MSEVLAEGWHLDLISHCFYVSQVPNPCSPFEEGLQKEQQKYKAACRSAQEKKKSDRGFESNCVSAKIRGILTQVLGF